MAEVSSFTAEPLADAPARRLLASGSTCRTFVVNRFGKLLFKKELKAEFRGMPQYVAAFRKEFEVGFRLNHPALPRYISLDWEDGCPCIYEEFVDGVQLDSFVRQNPRYFSSRQHADGFVDELLSAIAYLHSH